MKKLLSIILAFIMLLPICALTSSAAESTITSLSFNVYNNTSDSVDSIKWRNINGTYFMFLPSNTNLNSVTVHYTGRNDIYAGSTKIVSGEPTSAFAGGAGSYTLTCGGQSYNLNILCGANISAMYISTESGSLDYIHANKENKEPGNIAVYDQSGKQVINTALKQIKGRGNATWTYAKKPYNIKFDKKTSVLGMAKAKKWTLLAGCVFDNALMKNTSIFNIAQAIGLPETSEYRYVDLYINGNYMGVYTLCESVEIADNRIETTDLDKANEDANAGVDIESLPLSGTRSGYNTGSKKWVDIPVNPENITGGYLLEVDYLYRYHSEISGFISNVGMPIVLKSPEYASKAEVDYISSLWNDAEEALYSSDGYNSKGIHFTDYFDFDALVKVYLIQELSKNVDSGITSCYFYKKANDNKFYAGPVWDFDHALGYGTNVSGGLTVYEPDTWYANQLRRNSIDKDTNPFLTIFAQCYTFSEFRNAVSEKWQNTFTPLLNQEKRNEFESLAQNLTPSAVMNHIRWNTYNSTNVNTVTGKYHEETNNLVNFLFTRKQYLNKGFAANGATVQYNINGGTGGLTYNAKIYSVGETATASSCGFSKNGYIFVGWNTEADGNGKTVMPGQTFVVDENYTVLYAQWEKNAHGNSDGCDHICHSSNSFLNFFWKIERFFLKLFGTQKTCKCGVQHY